MYFSRLVCTIKCLESHLEENNPVFYKESVIFNSPTCSSLILTCPDLVLSGILTA